MLVCGAEMRYPAAAIRRRERADWRLTVGEAGAASMMTLPELAADSLEEFLGDYMRRRYGSSQTGPCSCSRLRRTSSLQRCSLRC